MATVPLGLLQRTYASRALDVAKMRDVLPCDVDDRLTGYHGRIVEVAFDPLRIEETDLHFRDAGYGVDDDLHAIALTEAGELLLWGGFNSIYALKKGERVVGVSDHLAFNDPRESHRDSSWCQLRRSTKDEPSRVLLAQLTTRQRESDLGRAAQFKA